MIGAWMILVALAVPAAYLIYLGVDLVVFAWRSGSRGDAVALGGVLICVLLLFVGWILMRMGY